MKCPLCNIDTNSEKLNNRDAYKIECKKCGNFNITSQAIEYLKNNTQIQNDKYKISSYTRECKVLNKKPPFLITGNKEIFDENFYYVGIDLILKEKFPNNVLDILDRTLINLSKLSKKPGQWIEFNDEMDFVLAYSDNADIFKYILDSLAKKNYIEVANITKISIYGDFYTNARLTPEGWNRVYELEKNINKDSKKVFVAMSFDKEMDEVWERGFKEAIKELGFEPVRVDEIEHNEKICDVIIAQIKKSKFLVADFTGNRGGVYYETGFAKGLGIPVIFTCKEGEEKILHFDTRQYNHIIWKDIDDLKKQLKDRIEATII